MWVLSGFDLAQQPITLGAEIIDLIAVDAEQFLEPVDLHLKLRAADCELMRFRGFSGRCGSSHATVVGTVP